MKNTKCRLIDLACRSMVGHLDLPCLAHHQIEIAVQFYRSTDSRVVILKLFVGNLKLKHAIIIKQQCHLPAKSSFALFIAITRNLEPGRSQIKIRGVLYFRVYVDFGPMLMHSEALIMGRIHWGFEPGNPLKYAHPCYFTYSSSSDATWDGRQQILAMIAVQWSINTRSLGLNIEKLTQTQLCTKLTHELGLLRAISAVSIGVIIMMS